VGLVQLLGQSVGEALGALQLLSQLGLPGFVLGHVGGGGRRRRVGVGVGVGGSSLGLFRAALGPLGAGALGGQRVGGLFGLGLGPVGLTPHLPQPVLEALGLLARPGGLALGLLALLAQLLALLQRLLVLLVGGVERAQVIGVVEPGELPQLLPAAKDLDHIACRGIALTRVPHLVVGRLAVQHGPAVRLEQDPRRPAIRVLDPGGLEVERLGIVDLVLLGLGWSLLRHARNRS
jgi:hypothetical protein